MTDLECTATPFPTRYCGFSSFLLITLSLCWMDATNRRCIFQSCCFVHWLTPSLVPQPLKSSQLNLHLAGPCDPPLTPSPSSPSVALQESCPSSCWAIVFCTQIKLPHFSLLALPALLYGWAQNLFSQETLSNFTVSRAIIKARCLSTTRLAPAVPRSPSFVQRLCPGLCCHQDSRSWDFHSGETSV